MLHVLVGTNDEDLAEILSAPRRDGKLPDWIVPKRAEPGDDTLLFVHSTGFLGHARIATRPEPAAFRGQPAYRSNLADVRLFATPVPLAFIRRVLPEWGWLNKRVKSRTTLDVELALKLRHAVAAFQDDLAEKLVGDTEFLEGREAIVAGTRWERDPAARAACIKHYGTACAACGMTFRDAYGEEMDGLIVVHHLNPMSAIRREYRVNPIRDLRPVCANCHFVMHRQTPPFSIDEVRAMMTIAREHLDG